MKRRERLVNVPVREMPTPEEREAARVHFNAVGLPVRCQGCKADYRTNVPACPKCGRGRSNQ